MTFLAHLDWRHAAKSFHADRKVSEADLQKILDSIRMSPSSFGLQSYHIHVITDQGMKDKIQEISWNQAQVGTSSHLLVFSARLDVEERIEQYLEVASGGDRAVKKKLNGYRDMMQGFLLGQEGKGDYNWASRQAYIALGFAMAACSELEIDSCPMEGCDFRALDTLLSLPSHLQSCVMLPIGYADMPGREKVRFSEEDLFTIIQ